MLRVCPWEAVLRDCPGKSVLRTFSWKPVLRVSPWKYVGYSIRFSPEKAAFGISPDKAIGHLKENAAS